VAPAPSVPVGLASPAVQRLIAEVRRKLGPGMADVLTAQERLAGSLAENGRAQSELEARIYTAQHHLDQLDAELARLNADIDKTDGRIRENQAQVAAIARALYMEPGSFLMQVAEAGGPREAVPAGFVTICGAVILAASWSVWAVQANPSGGRGAACRGRGRDPGATT